jgi:hypothetical protein
MFEISRVCQVIQAEGGDGVGDDQVVVLRRGGQRAQSPDQGGTRDRQGGHAGDLPMALSRRSQRRVKLNGMLVCMCRSKGAIWHQGLQARPVLLSTDVGRTSR